MMFVKGFISYMYLFRPLALDVRERNLYALVFKRSNCKEESVKRKILGKTNLKVSVIGFGGLPIQKLSMREAKDLVREAMDVGINFFDTAEGYGDSEIKIGQGIRGRREDCIIATKFPCRSSGQVRAHIENSLRRLKTDYIDIYQIHQVSKLHELEQILGPQGALGELVKVKKEGTIRHIGITGHDPDTLKKAVEGSQEFETVQFPFNIVEDGESKRALLSSAKELKLGIIIMKPLAGGVICEPQLSLRWILQQGADTVIPGVVLSSEVRENAMVGDEPLPLSSDELSYLKDAVKDLGKNFCRRCMYCVPCPQGVPIYLIQEWGDKAKVKAVKDMHQEMYSKLDKNALDCIECGECEKKCPYNLPIRKMLKEKHRLLTGK